ncbi:hypothetical protein Q5X45_10785 [Acinetobacter baumannii]|nr:hypothetical protein [Acinetobacter baumannii]HEM8710306.1 hypothetical protein [Acinetobacter baumannii]
MRIFFTCLIPLLSTFTTAQASTYEGVVQLINIREGDGLVWINIDGNRSSNIPECGKNHGYMVVKNEKGDTGKRQVAALMLAQATGQKVKIDGTNTCTRWPDGEDIEIVQIQKQ